MNLAAKITLAGSTAIIAALVALAAPAVAAIGEVAAWTGQVVDGAVGAYEAEPSRDPILPVPVVLTETEDGHPRTIYPGHDTE